MRPGQEAPDEGALAVSGQLGRSASMRPGQEAPDESRSAVPPGGVIVRFNEAGARSPG